ncbi:MAG: 1-deoxy-D-xylulose-5-phosphate synthase [Victivallales bacterium]|nr:1-deoxy-D-xylulose-5-phosphate synthase [Victivallales bacterium]MCF7888835.1 1-deoxy-D-xylulose-5-phosphate synthase [Victivallales bacterium]
MSILGFINSPEDARKLNNSELITLCKEIRNKIIEVTSVNGGHTAPNLGVVELTVAMHYIFNTPKDKILWDVSHQTYAHKLITGRNFFFNTLRKDNGCCGFTSPKESEYDCFYAGHAGTAVSAALGMAVARDRQGGKEKIISVIGDGSLTNGITFEGLNNISETTKDLILVLNDNKMSISKNVGGMTSYLNRIILKRGYNKTRNFFKRTILKIPRYGNKIRKTIGEIEEAAKSLLVPGVFFEELGIRYIGPIDGHNLKLLLQTFELIKEFDSPVVVHVLTTKGKGYKPAELYPEKFHGLSGFELKTGKSKSSKHLTFSEAFGHSLVKLADKHREIVGITAAMKSGTGMDKFAQKFPDRFFDVGIAEEHATVFAAGLAAKGLRPVFAVYSTFLQRSLGCLFHDICLQGLPLIICADRAGIVADGPTHHGVNDLSYIRSLPNISILYPADKIELENMLFEAYEKAAPVIIKYSKDKISKFQNTDKKIKWGKALDITEGQDLSIWATGGELLTALKVKNIINTFSKVEINIVNTRFIRPFDEEKLINTAQKMPVVTIEDNRKSGGLASTVDETLINIDHKEILHFGYSNNIIPHGTPGGIKKKMGLTPERIAEKILDNIDILSYG